MFPLLWAHRTTGCRGFIHEPGGEHECGGDSGTVAEPAGGSPWPAVLPTWASITDYGKDGTLRRRRGAA
jgi:hypothetical protein